jgi:hypothetical protein
MTLTQPRHPLQDCHNPILRNVLSVTRVLTASYLAASATALLMEPPAQNFVFGLLSPATVALALFAAAAVTLFANPLRAVAWLRLQPSRRSEPATIAVRN